MINPLEEVYIIFEKSSGDLKTGGGSSTKPSVHAYSTETDAYRGARRIDYRTPDEWGIAKYKLVETKEA